MSNRGGRGRGRGRGGGWNNNNRRDASSDNFSNNNIRPRSDNSSNSERARIFRNPQDVERENVQILSGNFESSELTYKGSDKVVFIPHEDEIQSMWKRLLKKELNNQHHIRRFLNSCLVVASGNSDYELSDLIAKLSEPDVIYMLEILVQRNSVDDQRTPQNELLRDDPHSFFPTSLGQFFLVIVRLCSILLDRMRDAAVNDAMNDIIQRLEDAKLSWQNSFSTQQGNSNDPLYSNINRRDYFFFILDKEFKKVKQVIKKHSKRTFLNEQNSIDESSLDPNRNNKILRKYQEKGGKYRQDNGDLYIYPRARFVRISVDKRRGFSCRIAFSAPTNSGKNVKERTLYWKKHSKKLMNGNLTYQELENIQKDADQIQERLNLRWLDWKEVSSYLYVDFHEHYNKFFGYQDPEIPSFLLEDYFDEECDLTGKDSKNQTLFDKWLHGVDIKNARAMLKATEDSKQLRKGKKNNNTNTNVYDALANYDDELNEYYKPEDSDCTLIIGDITLPSCGHKYPNAKCYESRNVNSVLCRVKVFKTLPKCGHKLEVMCNKSVDDIILIDILEFKTFAETDLEKERVIILDCGHVFTMETMDHHMEMEKYYQGDYGNWTDLVLLSSKSGENKIMTCPTCRAPIKSKRYGRSIKKRILDTQNKKFLTKYDLLLKYQRDALEKIINKIENNRPKLLEKFRNRTYPKSNNKKIDDKNTMDTNKTLSEVSESEKFYQIENYNEKSKAQFDSLFNNLENLNVIEDTESPENQKKRFEQSLRDVVSELPKMELAHTGNLVLETQRNWIKFCSSINDSINNHLVVIIQTCKESLYKRHLVVASMEYVEFEYQFGRFIFNNLPRNIVTPTNKEELKNRCNKIRKDCEKILNDVLPKVELEYFQSQCTERISKLLKNVDEFHDTVERSGQLSQQEKLEISRAMSSEFIGSGRINLDI
ncbi:920_t:CDS:10 [Rhizophagus irregularis]|nr:920_t:CDS:10 [Rhizophagus irregularis]